MILELIGLAITSAVAAAAGAAFNSNRQPEEQLKKCIFINGDGVEADPFRCPGICDPRCQGTYCNVHCRGVCRGSCLTAVPDVCSTNACEAVEDPRCRGGNCTKHCKEFCTKEST